MEGKHNSKISHAWILLGGIYVSRTHLVIYCISNWYAYFNSDGEGKQGLENDSSPNVWIIVAISSGVLLGILLVFAYFFVRKKPAFEGKKC